MNLKGVSYKRLQDHEERSIAHLAARARIDTIHGGARAMVISRRLELMGSKINTQDIVGDVYRLSSGNWHPKYEAWECPECGQAYLGQDKAYACCQPQEDESDEPVITTWGDLKAHEHAAASRSVSEGR